MREFMFIFGLPHYKDDDQGDEGEGREYFSAIHWKDP
jgi:hypothetical protein